MLLERFAGSVRALQSSVGTPSPHPQSRNSTPRPLQQDFDESPSTASTSNVAGPSQTRQLSPSSLQDLERSLTPPSSPNTTGPSQIDRSTTPSPPAHPSTPINRLQKLRAQSESLSPLSDLSTSGTSSPGISSVMEVEAAVWAEPVAIASSSNRTSNPTRSRKRRRTTTGSSGPSKRAKGKSRKVVPDSDEELDSVCHWPEKLSLKKGSIQKDVSSHFEVVA